MKKLNPHLQHLIEVLKSTSAKEGVGIWKRVAADLAGSTSKRCVVNLSRINRYAKKDECVIVPGKVLSSGELTQPVQVAAFGFSKSAKEKIENANGKVMSIHQLIEKNPKGKEVRILG
ncbi:50S ribosomal protein L18e [Candidatus Woesearchaeota archaeon CG10_big_fil_rev_8_21_14_0_10_34_8]|nr:MAG: 50S ribosomal protein L18e [Candidatus Woesearchaeota archaeon CG10_big_fil_rev_8_21_14_0_10_34_8]